MGVSAPSLHRDSLIVCVSCRVQSSCTESIECLYSGPATSALRTRYMVAAVGYDGYTAARTAGTPLAAEYRSATALDKESETRQVSVLLYCMEESAGDVLTSTKIFAKDRKKYQSVVKQFDEFFDVRRNVILERAKFNRLNQRVGESAEQYITALYSLVETCEYPADLVDEMLRNRPVVGMRHIALAERLQLDSELTLEKTKKAMRQKVSGQRAKPAVAERKWIGSESDGRH